jgi:hypothetical protein
MSLEQSSSFPKFSATDNWCDSWFLHSSFPWQPHMLVHDKFCSTQTQLLLQMDLPLNIHIRSCKKSDVTGPSKYFDIKYLFSFLHPYSKGDLGGSLASLACVHTYTLNATRNMCCLNAVSDGGSLTREESFDKANFTLSLFRSLWTDLALPFESYRSATNSLPASTHVSTSELARFVKVWYFAYEFYKLSSCQYQKRMTLCRTQ